MAHSKYVLYVQGMRCRSCGARIEKKLSEVPGVIGARVNASRSLVEVVMDHNVAAAVLAHDLSAVIEGDGYRLSVDQVHLWPRWHEFYFAAPIAIVCASLFLLLQKAGLVNFITADRVNFASAFGIGLVASVSSCLAVVGGLLLSVSAQYAKEGRRTGPQILFHAGRLISFLVFGGIIGFIGSAFTLSAFASLVLGVLVGLVMLSLGLNLLDVFPWAKRLQPRLPHFLMRISGRAAAIEHDAVPFLIGVSTFFLPCGFTQSMQVYSLSTGSFVAGAVTMVAFALGTLPVLALISFTSVELGKGKWSGVFFKVAGLLVLAFGAMNIVNSLVAGGYISPLFGSY